MSSKRRHASQAMQRCSWRGTHDPPGGLKDSIDTRSTQIACDQRSSARRCSGDLGRRTYGRKGRSEPTIITRRVEAFHFCSQMPYRGLVWTVVRQHHNVSVKLTATQSLPPFAHHLVKAGCQGRLRARILHPIAQIPAPHPQPSPVDHALTAPSQC